MINPASLLNLKRCFGLFRTNHPKAIQFAEAVAGKITEGSIVEINVQFPDGTKSKAIFFVYCCVFCSRIKSFYYIVDSIWDYFFN